jgi:hypothetical protein
VLRVFLITFHLLLTWVFQSPAFAYNRALVDCVGFSLTTEKPVSGSLDQFLLNAENIDKILGEPDAVGRPFVTPARRAFQFMSAQTGELRPEEKAQMWSALAAELHRRYPSWESRGPFRVKEDGSYVYQGGLGIILMVRSRDGRMFVGPAPFFPQPNWSPDYYKLKPLEIFIQESNEKREAVGKTN